MTTKIISSLAVIAVVSVAVIGGTYAYFTSTRISTGNTMATGNFELSVSNGNGYHADDTVVFGTAANMAPGDAVGPFNLYFKNTGVIEGKIKVNMSYVAREDETDADAFAKKLIVTNTVATVQGQVSGNNAQWWAQQIIDEVFPDNAAGAVAAGAVVENGGTYLPTMYGLKQITLYFWPSYSNKNDVPFAPNAEANINLTMKFDSSADNAYMNKGINITVTSVMNQMADGIAGSW